MKSYNGIYIPEGDSDELLQQIQRSRIRIPPTCCGDHQYPPAAQIQRIHMINEFQGEYRFLSNFYPARVTWMGHVYPTIEHAFQAAKFAAHPDVVKEIQEAESPGQSKKIARKHSQRVPAEWTIFTRELVMMYLLQQKFAKGTTMGDKLVATGDANLIEGNSWGDTFWGVCDGKGENTLGQMLMIIRAQIR